MRKNYPIIPFLFAAAMLAPYRCMVLGAALVALSSPSFATAPADPFGMDRGEARDVEAFTEWLQDPEHVDPHPLVWLRAVARSKKIQRQYYFRFFNIQTGLKGRAAQVAEELADMLFAHDSYLTEVYRTDGRAGDLRAVTAKIERLAAEFFRLVPRAQRVRVYRVAEKFESARLVLMNLDRMEQTELSDAWMRDLREQESRERKGYLYGMLAGRDRETAQRVEADFRMTMEYLLTFSKPPSSIGSASARRKFVAAQKRTRNRILKSLQLFAL